jgi:NADH-ubiquinone oxidoreductase chain 5
MPVLSTLGVIYYPLLVGKGAYDSIDQGWREQLGSQNIYRMFIQGAVLNQVLQNNNLKIYLLRFVLWFIILLILRIY